MARIVSGLLFGFGPGIAFLLAYMLAPVPTEERIFVATAVFMSAAVALMVAYRFAKRKLRPLPWPTLLVVIMGSLTLWLRDETFIKMRPTVQFAGATAIAAFALATGGALMDDLRRLDAAGQRIAKLALALFGIAAAAANELVWRNSSTLFWVVYQLWGPMLIFLLVFAISYPMVGAHYIGQRKAGTPQ